MGSKAAETSCDVNEAFGTGTANEGGSLACSGGSRRFVKDTGAVKMRSGCRKVTTTSWEHHRC